jgi:pSer/pThr/pTyr-binding forkhead associated (FHA) protein
LIECARAALRLHAMTILTVTVLDGPLTGKSASVAEGSELRVGRGENADLSVMDPNLSRIHFMLACEEVGWVVRDLNSRNGSQLNGRPISEAPVVDGDKITAGFTSFHVRIATTPVSHRPLKKSCGHPSQPVSDPSSTELNEL